MSDFRDFCHEQDHQAFFNMTADELRLLIARRYAVLWDENEQLDDPHAEKISMTLRWLALRADQPPQPLAAAKWNTDAEYKRFVEAYPKRRGGLNFKYAYKAWLSKRKEHAAAPMIDGARRYREFCIATDRVDTVYVQMVSTFLNQENWLQAWDVPVRTFVKHPSRTADPAPLPPSARELLLRRQQQQLVPRGSKA